MATLKRKENLMTRKEYRLAKLASRMSVLNSRIYTLEHRAEYSPFPLSFELELELENSHCEVGDLQKTLDRLSK